MRQTYENNKRRIQTFKLTADVKDDNGVVHHFFEGYEYVEIGGLKWAMCNVGAENETDGGLYFAWGEIQGYKNAKEKHFAWNDYEFGGYGNMLKYNGDGLSKLEPCDDAATVNMGKNWRMPTCGEYKTLLSSTINKWATVDSVKGRLFTDINDSSKKLFFPAIGICSNGRVYYVGSIGFYWSSSLDTHFVILSSSLNFGSWPSSMGFDYRNYGFPVRGVIK